MNDLSQPFKIPSYKYDDAVDELGKMPFGNLIGNILTSCVEAQTRATETAWRYTQSVLEQKTPMVFTFQDQEGLKRLEMPLFTIVPLPYMKLDNIDIDFDAEVGTLDERKGEFLVTVNNASSEGDATQVVKTTTNLHIGINAGTTDMPVGLAMLLRHMGGGLIVEDLNDPARAAEIAKIVASLEKHALEEEKHREEIRRMQEEMAQQEEEERRRRDEEERKRQEAEGNTVVYFASPAATIDNTADYAGDPLKGVHVIWTKAATAKDGTSGYYKMSEIDLLSTITSALLWRKFNGPIKLYTDSAGLEYFQRINITGLWNGGIDTSVLDRIPNSYDPSIFYNAGRIFAIQAETTPFTVLDTDMLVWQPLRPLIGDKYVMGLHPEPLAKYQRYYPEQDQLMKKAGWAAPSGWNWSVDPINTAITFFGNSGPTNYYVQQALRFMGGNNGRTSDMDSPMRFVDRRMFAMCMKAITSAASTFLASDTEEGKPFTHIWGANPTARDNEEINRQICTELVKIIKTHFADIPMPPQVISARNHYRQ